MQIMRDFTWFSFKLAQLALEILINADVYRMLRYLADCPCGLPDEKMCMWLLADPRYIPNIACNNCLYRKVSEYERYFKL